MRSFWNGTEWAIHKLLPCINMEHILNPIWKPQLCEKPIQTHQRKENGQHSSTYLVVLTFGFRGLDILSKDCTCPFIGPNMKDSPDMGFSGTRPPLYTGELIESFSSLRLICKSPFPYVGSHTVFQGSKLNNENCKVNPGVLRGQKSQLYFHCNVFSNFQASPLFYALHDQLYAPHLYEQSVSGLKVELKN